MANRLASETSPYLLQHAHNPVDWYPWGAEALARARSENKPIFLSIGYAACHWCHVMERESFEDPATAEQLNRDFVAIKVDREERPDLDAVYMDAVQAMTGSGGWPLSVFLTPEARPFYGGTYFPSVAHHGLPSFRDVLTAVATAWLDQRTEVEAAGVRLVAALNAQALAVTHPAGRPDTDSRGSLVPGPLDPTVVDAAVFNLEREFDAVNGGWGGAPKFPQPTVLEFLLRRASAGDARALAMARQTLDRMAWGGIHDQLGGGFARYATDATWLVPHFEKMLYDNAQLARVYLDAWRFTGEPRYRQVAETTLAYLTGELGRPDGTFAASQDADTLGVEGATYSWDLSEVEAVLREAGAEAGVGDQLLEAFLAAYPVPAHGNWEGRTILARVHDDAEVARLLGWDPAATAGRLATARRALLARRAGRPQPARDDKALTAWNGLALGAFAEAARAFDADPGGTSEAQAAAYRGVATRAAEAILNGVRAPDGRLRRSWKDGRALHEAVLEDYTHLADSLLSLYEATFEERWFTTARELTEVVLARFADPGGGFYDTADDHEALVARPRGLQDGALPSGNAMAATVLLRLAAWTGEGRYRDAAERTLAPVTTLAGRHPTGFGQWLVAMDLAIVGLDEVAIVGAPSDERTRALARVASRRFRPHQVLAAGADPSASAVPLLGGRFSLDGLPTAFVCRDFACRQPVTQPEALAALLAG